MTTTNIAPALLDKDAVRGVYERIAPLYDAWALLTETCARRTCLDLARVRDGESVLEVAVGTAMTFAELLARNPSGRNEGIDLTEGCSAAPRSAHGASGAASSASRSATPTPSTSRRPRSTS